MQNWTPATPPQVSIHERHAHCPIRSDADLMLDAVCVVGQSLGTDETAFMQISAHTEFMQVSEAPPLKRCCPVLSPPQPQSPVFALWACDGSGSSDYL